MSAVEAAVAVAAAYGLRCDQPVVLSEAWHVLVHLRPFPVVARVTSGAAGVIRLTSNGSWPSPVTRLPRARRSSSRVISFRLGHIGATDTRSSSGATSSGRARSTRSPPAEGSAGSTTRLRTTTASFPARGRAAEVRAMLAPLRALG